MPRALSSMAQSCRPSSARRLQWRRRHAGDRVASTLFAGAGHASSMRLSMIFLMRNELLSAISRAAAEGGLAFFKMSSFHRAASIIDAARFAAPTISRRLCRRYRCHPPALVTCARRHDEMRPRNSAAAVLRCSGSTHGEHGHRACLLRVRS